MSAPLADSGHGVPARHGTCRMRGRRAGSARRPLLLRPAPPEDDRTVFASAALLAESFSFGDWLRLLSVFALVALNGAFVATEFSLVAVRRTKIEELIGKGVGRAKSVEAALDNLDRTIAAT